MQLVRQGGEQDPRPAVAARLRADRRAKQVLHLLGEKVLIRNEQFPPHPGLAHLSRQRRQGVHHKALQALLHQRTPQARSQFCSTVQANALQQRRIVLRRLGGHTLIAQGLDEIGKLFGRGRNNACRAVPSVEQTPDQTQAVELVLRVEALTIGVACRSGKTIAALPHPQRVLGQTGVALDSGDGKDSLFVGEGVHHGQKAGWKGKCTTAGDAHTSRAC